MKPAILALVVVVLSVALGVWLAYSGALGTSQAPGEISRIRRPAPAVSASDEIQAQASRRVGRPAAKQILFGDLHVHTTYSIDAFLTSLPLFQGEGAHPPADACDFARFCSALDFFSINDHAEGISPAMWSETKEMVRECNAVSGSASDPDLVAFLGWEWTQMAPSERDHYGHKNVILRETAEEKTPLRPIAARGSAFDVIRRRGFVLPGLLMAARDFSQRQAYLDFITFQQDVGASRTCPSGVASAELPVDCAEAVATPRELFEKLDEFDFPSMVIPHGNAWGNTTPRGIDWSKQLAEGNHDPKRQRLIEVYSGHGNSEEYRAWKHVVREPGGGFSCAPPTDDFTPECHRAGELIRERCLSVGFGSEECESRAVVARQNFVDAGRVGPFTVPGASAEDWLDSGSCRDCFQPAFRLRPGGSAQFALAVSGKGVEGAVQESSARFRFGFIASSDNHQARPASGYKEFKNLGMTDTIAPDGARIMRGLMGLEAEAVPESRAINPDEVRLTPGGEERLYSFFYTGGLVAAHSQGRDRNAIWDALERKEVYGTSGPRILLWFDLLNGPEGPLPMGSELKMQRNPRFRVRAVGSRKQLPGCPEYVEGALSSERLQALCMGECHNPGSERRKIEQIDVIRIRPRTHAAEDVSFLIDDPWLSFPCEPDENGCSVEFVDEEYESSGRDTLYYVRAIEEPSEHINGLNLRCTYDEDGNCIETKPCRTGAQGGECLGPDRARAWSSPIFIDQPGG